MQYFDAKGQEFFPPPQHVPTKKQGTRAVLVHKQNLLIIKEFESDVYALPGGGIETNETAKDAVVREVKEETGIDISHENFCAQAYTERGFYYHDTKAFRQYFITSFKIEASENLFFNGQKTTPENGSMQWVSFSNIKDYPLGIVQKGLIEVFLS